ncbi:uncharacterized protein LOC110060247, partial [Orbicella faveolata]|uniref:uncharacterized protein LOC110060247 n=1 Tax=Orbicella faveolata TaxID=48498 RepID=UPI0009E3BDC2
SHLTYEFCSSPPLTPSKIKQCVQNIWENEKLLFSEHLAMVLPGESYTYNLQKVEKIYDSQAILLRVSTNNSEENLPSTSSEKKKGHSTTLVQLAIKKLILSKECLDGKLELGIPWNPLAMSTIEMENCRKNLHRLSSWSKDKEEQAGQLDRHKTLSYSREKFQKSGIHG